MEYMSKEKFEHVAREILEYTDYVYLHVKGEPLIHKELEDILITADIGVNTVMDFIDKLRKRVKQENIKNSEELKEIIVDEMFIIYVQNDIIVNKINYTEEGPTVILMVGVNGVGKTTTIAKLGSKMITEGKKVKMVAGDTFRAGATKQLEEWAGRVGATFVGKEEGADPSSVIYDGLEEALTDGTDVVLIDTAGRLHVDEDMMAELQNIKSEVAVHQTLLVVDAMTGQDAVNVAESFNDLLDITGVVLTKLDGTSKGGIVLAIRDKYNLPIKMVGLGEKLEDLEYFDLEDYIMGLFDEEEDE